jgi:hypothetical protein
LVAVTADSATLATLVVPAAGAAGGGGGTLGLLFCVDPCAGELAIVLVSLHPVTDNKTRPTKKPEAKTEHLSKRVFITKRLPPIIAPNQSEMTADSLCKSVHALKHGHKR